ncbi:MAG: hypothetical protein JSS79_11230 [Bacteroidetes bacterium]|nr:hypothetical protein [Bacteroidota bacterium]
MRLLILLPIALAIISCATKQQKEEQSKVTMDTVSKAPSIHDTVNMLRPIAKDRLVSVAEGDTNVIEFRDKCVVFANYSDQELEEMQKSRSEEAWEGFIDDYSYYGNEASLFLYERTIVERASEKKYLRFIFTNGSEITIDRRKSVETIFFFNPDKGVKECGFSSFRKEEYRGY